jgi:hypothetical protein
VVENKQNIVRKVNFFLTVLDSWERFNDGVDSLVTKTFGEQFGSYYRMVAPFLIRAVSLIIYYFIGVGWYRKYEHWSYLDCGYFITVSLSTVGYGYLHPTTDQSRIFTSFYAIFGIGLFLESISFLSRTVVLWIQTKLVDTISPSSSVYNRSSKRFLMSVFFILFAVLIGTWFFAVVQKTWTSDMAFYWVIQTILTIGYGDLGDTLTDESKKFSIFFIIFVLVVYASAIQNVMDAVSESSRYRSRQKVLRESFSGMSDIELRGENPVHYSPNPDRNQYLIDTLVAMGLVDKVKDIEPILKVCWLTLFTQILFHILMICDRISTKL